MREAVFDVVVDLRVKSEIYGKWYGVTLFADNKRQFLIIKYHKVLHAERRYCAKPER